MTSGFVFLLRILDMHLERCSGDITSLEPEIVRAKGFLFFLRLIGKRDFNRVIKAENRTLH
jgi:hypothetical protein